MNEKNKIKEISKRKFNVIIGLLLALFSIALFINYTAFPRLFTFGIAYIFGVGSYLIYVILYLIGMSLLFNFKGIKNHKLIIIFGSILLVLGGLILTSHIAVTDASLFKIEGKADYYVIGFENNSEYLNFSNAYNKAFFNFESGKNYLSQRTINFFSAQNPIGGGLFGYLLLACGNQLFKAGGLVLSILLFVAAFGVYSIPLIKRIISAAKTRKASEVEEDEILDIHSSENVPEEQPIYETYESGSYDDPRLSESGFYLNDFDDTENGVFSKPVFNPVGSPIPSPVESPSFEKPFDNPTPTPVPTPAPVPAPTPSVSAEPKPAPVMTEQLTLDFDEKPEFDESLVTAKPVFPEEMEEVVPAPVPVTPTPVTVSEPVAEEPKKEPIKWVAPSSDMLKTYPTAEQEERNNAVALERQAVINDTFASFKIRARVDSYVVGSSVTRFNITYDEGVSNKSVSNIVSDISIKLGGVATRFTPVVEGSTCSGLEVPNACITTVSFKEVYDGLPDVKKHPLAVAFGKNISGQVVFADYDEFPHMLVAGTTGSGKSIFVNSIIATLIMRNSPDDLKVVLVDPKTVEMTRYKDMPHLLRPILYTAQEAYAMGKKLCEEMERRYKLFGETGATNIKEYNADVANGIATGGKIPYILFVLDEYADLIEQCKELSLPVVSLAQKARACGIHLLISTQRPSTNVVTGTIKANLPTHVALMTSSSTDSITIIGEGGAEKLLGKGDMLVQSPLVSRVGAVRLQGCFASRDEILMVVKYLKENYPTVYDPKFLNLEEEAEAEAEDYKNSPTFQEAKGNDEESRYQAIKEWVMSLDYVSISRIQRECAVGFNRAGRFFLRLQQEGIVDTKVDGNKGCKVLVQDKFGEEADIGSDEVSYFREDD